MATACYNTCFALEEKGQVLLVDGGGGNQIFTQLEKAGIPWMHIQDLFVTHKHMDHILGALWMIRLVCQSIAGGKHEKPLRVYGHGEVIELLRFLTSQMLVPEQAKLIGGPVQLICVADGEHRQILGRDVCFFDIGSPKALQFGFSMELKDGERLVCCGDEPCGPCCEDRIRGCKWLMLEAFCRHADRDIFHPYEKHHSTVKDACQRAALLQVQNLLLYHTEDQNLQDRKELYRQEGTAYFSGNIYVPEDLESLELE